MEATELKRTLKEMERSLDSEEDFVSTSLPVVDDVES